MTGRRDRVSQLQRRRELSSACLTLIEEWRPDAVVHFAEQRAAPYSMKSSYHKRYTVNNNLNATNNLLAAIVESRRGHPRRPSRHDGRLRLWRGRNENPGRLSADQGRDAGRHENRAGDPVPAESGQHLSHDQDARISCCSRSTTRTTRFASPICIRASCGARRPRKPTLDERLINRFDYDGDYGTVLNRFLMQAAIELSVDRSRHRRPDPRLHQHPGYGALHRACDRQPAAEGRARAHLQPDDRDVSPHRSRPR